jgi:DNA polymerase III gamma/tau subunit
MSKEIEVQPFDGLDEKYRPKTLERVIGHEVVVTQLQGMIASKKLPKTLLFMGPSSAGKTTLGRAFSANLFGVDSLAGHPDYLEINAANARKIEDMRQLLSVVKLKPMRGVRRVILLDEAQQITGDAAQVLLKPLEAPPPMTMFILCSMEPEKLSQAVLNRCTKFALKPADKEGLTKYCKRIAKGESLDFVTPEILEKVVENSNGEYRTAAHTMQSLAAYAAGRRAIKGAKAKITAEGLNEALESNELEDDQIAVKYLTSVYAGKPKQMIRCLLDTGSPFQLVNTILRLNSWLLNKEALGPDTHKTVWNSKLNFELLAGINKFANLDPKKKLQAYLVVHDQLVELRKQAVLFGVGETALLISCGNQAMASLEKYREKSK